MYGVPARIKGWVSKAGEPLTFDEKGTARCPSDGSLYKKRSNDRIQWVE